MRAPLRTSRPIRFRAIATRTRSALVSSALGCSALGVASLALAPLASAPLAAQSSGAAAAPASQPSDSIARFAINPAVVGDATVLLLLDELTVDLQADGRSTRTYRNVAQVATQGAVNGAAERRFSWQPGRQAFTLDWVRVLRPDGSVVSDQPSADQTSDATASMNNPIYVDSRTRRLSLAGVAPNTIVDVQYTIVDTAPWRPGDFFAGWSFSPPIPLRRSHFRLRVPQGFTPYIEEANLTFRRTETDENGYVVYDWRANSPPVVRDEPFAADSDGVRMTVSVASPQPWDSVSQWYSRLATPRTVIDSGTARQLDAVVVSAASRRDTLLALHKWIAQDIRYVSVSLGLGGYQPRSPADVFATGFGDCKDKTTLFVAAARRWGIDARPVLLNLSGVSDLRTVSIARFNHAIAAVVNADGDYTFTDLTAATIPYGALPASYRDSWGIMVRPDGSAEQVRFPERVADSVGNTTVMRGVLSADGRLDLTVTETPRGDDSWTMRAAFGAPLDSARRATGLRAIANRFLPESSADSLIVFDGRDFTATPSMRVVLRDGRGARPAGPVWLLHLPTPLRQMASGAARMATELDAQPKRRMTIDASRIVGNRTMIAEYRVLLPDGWTAQLPPPITTTSFFARYESRSTMEGRELVMRRSMQAIPAGIQRPERVAEVAAWMRAVAADDLEFVTLILPSP